MNIRFILKCIQTSPYHRANDHKQTLEFKTLAFMDPQKFVNDPLNQNQGGHMDPLFSKSRENPENCSVTQYHYVILLVLTKSVVGTN